MQTDFSGLPAEYRAIALAPLGSLFQAGNRPAGGPWQAGGLQVSLQFREVHLDHFLDFAEHSLERFPCDAIIAPMRQCRTVRGAAGAQR